jgi:predicted PurR-regulated permease PerM
MTHDPKTPSAPAPTPPGEMAVFTRKTLIVVVLAATAILLGLLVWYATDVVLLSFASVLFAVAISTPSRLLSHYTRIPHGYALLLVLGGLLVLLLALGLLVGNSIAQQVQQMRELVPQAFSNLLDKLQQTKWGPDVLLQVQRVRDMVVVGPEIFTRAGGVITGTFGFIGNVVLVVGIGIFLAGNPRLYVQGVLSLLPIGYRARGQHVLEEAGLQLQWWFLGQMVSMISIALLTWLGLAILGVPMALTLALLAGLLSFIPNFGPIMAAIPAILLAVAPHGTQLDINFWPGLYVAILYMSVQFAEGMLITPFVQERAVALPPALTMVFQVLMGILVGPLGLVLATPMLAALLVLGKKVYIEDVLGDRADAATK